jgi:hypothetical protein
MSPKGLPNPLPARVLCRSSGTMEKPPRFSDLGAPQMAAPGPGHSTRQPPSPEGWPGPQMVRKCSEPRLRAARAALFFCVEHFLCGTDNFLGAFSCTSGWVRRKHSEVQMNAVKSLALVALLLGGTSLALAQNGPPTGGQPPTAAPASPGPPPPGLIPHDAPRTQATAPGPNLQSAAPGPGPSAGTRIAHRTPRWMYMQVRHFIPGCAVGQPAAATCACGAGTSGGPLLCQPGQWCHYPFAQACTQ